jgi:GNAT superfamily N-acetyltransferase
MSDAITVFDLDADLADVRALMTEYADTLDVRDRCFQNMDAELAGLPGEYVSPNGALFVARSDEGEAVGCIALHGMGEGVCEMKRLYVKPSAQGRGLGRRLAETLIGEARRLGFTAMRLDTFEAMVAARALYADLGFKPIAPYNDNPMPGLHYLELTL